MLEEGLQARFERHRRVSAYFLECARGVGLAPFVAESARLPQLTTLRVPEGVDDLAVRKRLLSEHNLEIGGGLGALKGQLWRVGLMGYGATEANAERCAAALREQIATERGAAARR